MIRLTKGAALAEEKIFLIGNVTRKIVLCETFRKFKWQDCRRGSLKTESCFSKACQKIQFDISQIVENKITYYQLTSEYSIPYFINILSMYIIGNKLCLPTHGRLFNSTFHKSLETKCFTKLVSEYSNNISQINYSRIFNSTFPKYSYVCLS